MHIKKPTNKTNIFFHRTILIFLFFICPVVLLASDPQESAILEYQLKVPQPFQTPQGIDNNTNVTVANRDPLQEPNMHYEYDDIDINELLLLRAEEEGIDLDETILMPPAGNIGEELAEQLRQETERYRRRVLTGTTATTPRTLLIPINLDNIHWAGLVIRLNANNQILQIQYIDPLGDMDENETLTAIKKNLRMVYGNRIQIEQVTILRQTDGAACGVLTIENLIRAAQRQLDQIVANREITREIRRHHIELMERFRGDLHFAYRQRNNISNWQVNKQFALSFRTQLTDGIFWEYLPGRLLLFFGTSCAGKSSIICELEKNEADIQCKPFGAFFKSFLVDQILALQHPEIPILRQHFSAIEVYEIMEWNALNPNCSPECIHTQQSLISKKNYLEKIFGSLNIEEICYKLIAEIIPQLRQGKTVVIDYRYGLNLLYPFYQHLFNSQTVKILVYCPYDVLINRMRTRNSLAFANHQLYNARADLSSFKEFLLYYKRGETKNQSIDLVNAERLLLTPEFLTELNAILLKQGKDQISQKEMDKQNNKVCSIFALTPHAIVPIQPAVDCDLVINTNSAGTSSEIAEQLLRQGVVRKK